MQGLSILVISHLSFLWNYCIIYLVKNIFIIDFRHFRLIEIKQSMKIILVQRYSILQREVFLLHNEKRFAFSPNHCHHEWTPLFEESFLKDELDLWSVRSGSTVAVICRRDISYDILPFLLPIVVPSFCALTVRIAACRKFRQIPWPFIYRYLRDLNNALRSATLILTRLSEYQGTLLS